VEVEDGAAINFMRNTVALLFLPCVINVGKIAW
jgi:hypothetical protein